MKKYRLGRIDLFFGGHSIWQMYDAGFFFRIDLGKVGLVYWRKQG
jgi:hypothetical protein